MAVMNDNGTLLGEISALGELLDALERVRVGNGNRIGALQRRFEGEAFPHLHAIQKGLVGIEHEAELALVRTWRKHDLAPWARSYRGLGEKSIARLIAIIGTPTLRGVGHWEGTGKKRKWIVDFYEPRTIAQLRAFCGVGDPGRSRRIKDATQAELMKAGNPRARKQLFVIASAMLKDSCAVHIRERKAKIAEEVARTGKDPRQVQIPWAPPPPDCSCVGEQRARVRYDATRLKYADAVHERECVRCGPAGHPAGAGSPLSTGHQHARALRATGKTFLKDLWLAASELQDHADQQDDDLHRPDVRVNNGAPAQTKEAPISIQGTSARATSNGNTPAQTIEPTISTAHTSVRAARRSP